MMIRFPYKITETRKGSFKLNFIDFPIISVSSRNHLALRQEAARILDAVVSIRIRRGLTVPKPAEALDAIPVADHIDFRLNLYWSLCDSGLSREDFARDMNIAIETVNNILEGVDAEFHPSWINAIASQDPENNNSNIVALASTYSANSAQYASC